MGITQAIKDQLTKWPESHEAARWLYCMAFRGGRYRESAASKTNRLLRNCDEVVFVQVGANDGMRCDPINRLAKRNRSWRGVLVEPVDFVFKRLVSNYRGDARFQYVNKAVGTEMEKKPFYHLAEVPANGSGRPLPFWYDQIGSFDKNHILNLLGPENEPRIRTTMLDVVPLQSILDECGIEHLDVLHTDVEGYDWQVVKQLDLSRYRPAIIQFENKHVSAAELKDADAALHAAGYELHSDATDTLCVHPEALATLQSRRRNLAA